MSFPFQSYGIPVGTLTQNLYFNFTRHMTPDVPFIADGSAAILK